MAEAELRAALDFVLPRESGQVFDDIVLLDWHYDALNDCLKTRFEDTDIVCTLGASALPFGGRPFWFLFSAPDFPEGFVLDRTIPAAAFAAPGVVETAGGGVNARFITHDAGSCDADR